MWPSASHNVANHSLDWPRLGMMCNKYFVDIALSFSLHSKPYSFTAIADTVQWMVTHNHGVDFPWHYLDDFLTLGSPASLVCHNKLQAFIWLCSRLGLPLHPDKLRGPSTCLHILDIELNSTTLQAWLPPKKKKEDYCFAGYMVW